MWSYYNFFFHFNFLYSIPNIQNQKNGLKKFLKAKTTTRTKIYKIILTKSLEQYGKGEYNVKKKKTNFVDYLKLKLPFAKNF